jgi:hypothetical protein
MTIQEKIQSVVDTNVESAEKNGSTTLSTCTDRTWDQDIWNYRYQIMDAIRAKGYNVSSSTNFGVLDIVITTKITLK